MRLKWIIAASLLLVVGIVFAASLHYPFQFDDALFLEDDNVKLGRWPFFVYPPVPRLLTWLTFLAQYQLCQASPFAFHAVNIALHALNSLLVWAILLFLLQKLSPPVGEGSSRDGSRDLPVNIVAAAFGALVFSLHPVQAESVYYVYQRSTLLAAFFGFLAMLGYWKGKLPLAFAAFILAVASKEFMVILPVVLWVAEGILRGKWKPSPSVAILSTLSFAAVVGFLLRLVTSSGDSYGGFLKACLLYGATEVSVFWSYFRLVLIPHPLNLDRDIIPQESFDDPYWWIALVSLVLIVVLAIHLRRRQPLLSISFGFFVLFLIPTSSIVPSPDYMFEHRLYASILGWALLLSILFRTTLLRAVEKKRIAPQFSRTLPVLLLTVLTALVPVYGVLTHNRGRVWSDTEALWKDTVSKSPHKYRPNYNLGSLLMGVRPRDSIPYLSRAIQIEPSIPLAYQSLGEVYFQLGNLDECEQFWKAALSLNPADSRTHTALGKLHLRKHEFFEARDSLRNALQLDPKGYDAYHYAAQLNLQFGFVKEAIQHCETGLNFHPHRAELKLLLADAVRQTGNWSRAIELYNEGLRDFPDSLAFYRLARIHWRQGNLAEALAAARKGLNLAKSEHESYAGKALLDLLN